MLGDLHFRDHERDVLSPCYFHNVQLKTLDAADEDT